MKNLLFILLLAFWQTGCKHNNNPTNQAIKDSVTENKHLDASTLETVNKPEDHRLYEAAKTGNLKLVKQLLNKGANPNARGIGYTNHDENGEVKNSDQKWTALMISAYNNHLNVMKLLIEKGANITAYNTIGYTALHYACQSNHSEAAKLLLEHNAADYDTAKVKSGIPLYWALSYENEILSNLLIDKEENLNYESIETGRTNLINAFYNKLPNVGITMIQKGANINTLSIKYNESALMWAANHNNVAAVQLLLDKNANVNVENKSYYTALAFAAGNDSDDLRIPQMLITHGAIINPVNQKGRTALIEAASHNNIKIVQYLLSKGADPNQQAKNFGYISPLREAVFSCNFPMTKLLVENGANVNILTDNGSSILLEAVWNEKNIEIVKYLIAKGALVNKANDDGETPLLKSIAYNDPKMIKLLMENGADINITDGYGRTAITLAQDRNDVALLKLVQGYYKDN